MTSYWSISCLTQCQTTTRSSQKKNSVIQTPKRTVSTPITALKSRRKSILKISGSWKNIKTRAWHLRRIPWTVSQRAQTTSQIWRDWRVWPAVSCKRTLCTILSTIRLRSHTYLRNESLHIMWFYIVCTISLSIRVYKIQINQLRCVSSFIRIYFHKFQKWEISKMTFNNFSKIDA